MAARAHLAPWLSPPSAAAPPKLPAHWQPHRGQQRLCGWGKSGVVWTYVCERPVGARRSETEPGAVIKKIMDVARELTEAGRARQNRCRGGMGRTWASGARAAPAEWCSPTSTPRWAESRPVGSAAPDQVATMARPRGGTTGVSVGSARRRAGGNPKLFFKKDFRQVPFSIRHYRPVPSTYIRTITIKYPWIVERD